MRWLRRWAEPVTRRQLQRALAARDAARAEVRRLRGALADAERAAQTQHDIAGVWRSAALHRAAERDAALAQLAQLREQGEQQ